MDDGLERYIYFSTLTAKIIRIRFDKFCTAAHRDRAIFLLSQSNGGSFGNC